MSFGERNGGCRFDHAVASIDYLPGWSLVRDIDDHIAVDDRRRQRRDDSIFAAYASLSVCFEPLDDPDQVVAPTTARCAYFLHRPGISDGVSLVQQLNVVACKRRRALRCLGGCFRRYWRYLRHLRGCRSWRCRGSRRQDARDLLVRGAAGQNDRQGQHCRDCPNRHERQRNGLGDGSRLPVWTTAGDAAPFHGRWPPQQDLAGDRGDPTATPWRGRTASRRHRRTAS